MNRRFKSNNRLHRKRMISNQINQARWSVFNQLDVHQGLSRVEGSREAFLGNLVAEQSVAEELYTLQSSSSRILRITNKLPTCDKSVAKT